VITLRASARDYQLPRAPWIALAAVTSIYAAILLAVIPALERQKVVPDVARWVAGHAPPETPVATYQLNRWNTAFRFYVNRHVAMLDDPEQIVELMKTTDGRVPFFCVMLGDGYDDLVRRGVPIKEVYARDGMWATSGRALWRQAVPPTRFVVVTSRDETER
jgi:hypothetical protein